LEERIKTVQELLSVREAHGLRVPIIFRILFSFYGLLSAFFAPDPSGVIYIILCISISIIAINIYFLVLLRKAIRVRLVGVIGVIMDSLSLVLYPMIVYNIFGFPDQPLAVVSQMPLFTAAFIVFMVIESLALRPEYTVGITGAALLAHLGMIFVSIRHPSATWSYDYSLFMSDSEVSLQGIVHSMIFLSIIGTALVWLTRSVRRTVVQAAELEADKIHIVREQANLLLDSRISVMGELVAAVSHEMNNPLGVVKANAETGRLVAGRIRDNILQDSKSGESEDNIVRVLDTMEQNSRSTVEATTRLESVLKTLRSFARIDEAEYKLIDIHDALDSTLDLIPQDKIGATKILKQYGEIPKIRAYAGRINQVMMILLSRAFEVSRGEGTVSINTEHSEANALISITDSGPTMPQDELDKIFDVRLQPGKSRIEAGFGMAACRSIVDQHKGRIQIASSADKGTCFTLALPL